MEQPTVFGSPSVRMKLSSSIPLVVFCGSADAAATTTSAASVAESRVWPFMERSFC